MVSLASQAASRVDSAGNVLYYATLNEAFAAAAGVSLEAPDEITLLRDVTLAEPVLVDTARHIVLVPGNGNRTIMRGAAVISSPLFRVTGEGASLSLGKPGMEYGLFIDGGYLSTPPIPAEAPLVVVNGPDAKLIMHDKVTIQNNYNNVLACGSGEKWSVPREPFRAYLALIAAVLIGCSLLIVIVLKKKPSKVVPAPKEHIAAIQRLSPREREIFMLLLKNFTLRQISLELNISYNTVNTHYNSIYRKLGVSSRGELLTRYGSLHSLELVTPPNS
jgi:LuxR family transcriptional regulator of spore coat protein